jgi:uncharacterized repeat protein (TIGR01451 family)
MRSQHFFLSSFRTLTTIFVQPSFREALAGAIRHFSGRLALWFLALALMCTGRVLGQSSATDTGAAPPNASAPAAPPAPQIQQGIVHIVPFGRGSGAVKNLAAPAGAHLTYWGGPVISQVHVVAVFWGPNVNTAVTGGIGQFFTDITNSRYYDLLTEYSTVGVTGAGIPATSSNQSINRGVFDGAFTITPSVACVVPCTITDAQIQTELAAQIGAANLPQPVSDATGNVESFYMIYFPPGVTIALDPLTKSCVVFCAYHANTTSKVPYGVLPDLAPPSACAQGCGAGTVFQNVTAVTSHEMAEAVTDALGASATATAPPLGWYDPDPATNPLGEIGDICSHQDTQVSAGGNAYAVQTEFSNLQNDCVSAPPKFNLAAPATVFQNVAFNLTLSLQSSVTAFNLSGYSGTVHFTSSDPTAIVPADYTFTVADQGAHTFTGGFTMKTVGNQSITATDIHSSGFTGSTSVTVSNSPDLSITKSHTGAFIVGQTGATYTISVANVGGGPTSGTVTVTDSLPAGLTATAIGGTGWTCALGTLICTRADALPAGSSYPPITITVDVAANAPSQVTNTATVSGGGEINPANDTASDLTGIAAPDLTVSKFHNGPINGQFFQGETGATYFISVDNLGFAPTTAPVTVIDTLPAGLTATAISGTGWTCTLANLTCTRSDALALRSNYPAITVTVDVALNAPANVVNTATVSGGGEINTANDVAQDSTIILPPPAPDLSISVFNPANFVQGQTGSYIIGVSNVGTSATTGPVTVTDTLPAGLTATSISGTGWTCDLSTLTCSRSDILAFNASYPQITLNVNIAVNAPSSVTNSVNVSGGGDTVSGNNSANAVTPIAAPLVDLAVFATATSGFIQGQTNTGFVATVSNIGNTASAGTVTFSATLPAGLAVTDISGTGWTCTLGTLTCTRADSLNAGANYPAVNLLANVEANASGTLTARFTATGGTDGNAANNTTSVSVPFTPAITLNIIGGVTIVNAGQPASVTFVPSVASPAGTVTFSCGGLPAAAACSFNPASVNSTPATVTATITTTARGVAVFQRVGTRGVPPGGPLVPLLAALVISISRLRRTRLRPAFVLSVLLLLGLCLGCGGGSTPQTVVQNQTGTPAGTYTVVINATGANGITAAQPFQLTVR